MHEIIDVPIIYKLAAKVEKALGVPVTARNWNTVSKLFAMVKQA